MKRARAIWIATRGSRLALWQAHAVSERLEQAGIATEIIAMTTTGDRSQHGPVAGDDSKRQFVKENLARRSSELTSAESIVDQELARFASWLQSREIVPTIVALRQRFEQIRQGELRRLEPRLTGLTPEARAKVDEVTRLLIEKLLLTPTEQLKSVGDETVAAYAEALHRLFALSPVREDETTERDERLTPGARSR